MLNQPLYLALRKRFGDVKVVNEGQKRLEQRSGNHVDVLEAGESFSLCCPFCGDEKFRLSVSYKWLTRQSSIDVERVTHLINCYNENCPEVRKRPFWGPILEDVEAFREGLLTEADLPQEDICPARRESRQGGVIPPPAGFRLLSELPEEHEALAFLFRQYPGLAELGNLLPRYLSDGYGVGYTGEFDRRYPKARYRLIVPIQDGEKLVGWQGRTIRDVNPRWYIPPGLRKPLYNGHRVPAAATPIICEGVLNAIACGPNGVALFGKTMNRFKAEDFAKRWSSALIVMDPDVFVPDNRKGGKGRVYAKELQKTLRDFIPDVRMVEWPPELLELAARRNNNEDVKVPDAADLGFAFMRRMIRKALHD